MSALDTTDIAEAEVACVILPLGSRELVVPATCIAEVLPLRTPEPLPLAPSWCRGTIDWHGARVPVVDFEVLVGGQAAPAPGRALVVLNRTRPGAPHPFYALLLQGVPRLVAIADADLGLESVGVHATEALRIDVGTEQLVIPDLACLEDLLGQI